MAAMKFIDLTDKQLKQPIALPEEGGRKAVHIFDRDSIDAVNGALAARRPLLVRGPPGTGKSQLARAAAAVLKRPLVSMIVDAQTEPRDLLWTMDNVARLAQAQMMGTAALSDPKLQVKDALDEARFLAPGPLWWAFDWASAVTQAQFSNSIVRTAPEGWKPGDGVVLLLDEIDKADTSVPNGLLGALGSGWFDVPARAPTSPTEPGRRRVDVAAGQPPLVVVTSNQERVLPEAFVRRCLVRHLAFPDGVNLEDYLVTRGQAHLGDRLHADILRDAAAMLAEDRIQTKNEGLPQPGLAEYLDLVWALSELFSGDPKRQKSHLAQLRKFTFKKHVGG